MQTILGFESWQFVSILLRSFGGNYIKILSRVRLRIL